MKRAVSRTLLVLELLALLAFDLVACGMMRWIGDAPITPLRLLVVGLFLLLLASSGATALRAVDYFRGAASIDDEPGGAVRLLSLAVPVALIAVVLDTLVNPSERIGQLTTLTTLLFVAAAAPAVHLEIVAWRRPRGDPRRVWS